MVDGAKVLLSIPAGLLIKSGGFYLPYVTEKIEVWRIISYAFLHGNLLHIIFNMLALWQVGSTLEKEIEWQRFVELYFFSTVIAILFSSIASPENITIGASGALFGLIGFAISFYHRIGGQRGLARRNLMVQWAVYAIMLGIIMNADNGAHIGGAVAGFLLGILTPTTKEGLSRHRPFFSKLAYALIVLTGGCIGLQILGWGKAVLFFLSF